MLNASYKSTGDTKCSSRNSIARLVTLTANDIDSTNSNASAAWVPPMPRSELPINPPASPERLPTAPATG